MKDKPEVSGDFKADITKVKDLSALKVNDFVNFPASTTPGNVGVCFSGGGSRAMTAGMGQLQGLNTLKTPNGKTLLEQTKAVSTVSGGSWLGTTFQYLDDPDVSDIDYFGNYRDPGQLNLKNLNDLSEKTIGFRCTKDFSIPYLLVAAFYLWSFGGIPANMLWQTLIGIHILQYYDLFASSDQPNSFFSYDTKTRQDIVDANSSLAGETAHLIASGGNRIHRPYVVCNMSMFVNMPNSKLKYLVPVQSTPFFTGIVSTPPEGTDANGRNPGGGGVTSFAFSSNLNAIDSPDTVTVEQSRQFALVDAIGTSSAAFAETLENLAANYLTETGDFLKHMTDNIESIQQNIAPRVKPEKSDAFAEFQEKIQNLELTQEHIDDQETLKKYLKGQGLDLDEDILSVLNILTDIVPQYQYWPIVDIAVNSNVKPTGFADAGSLDNTAITAMLTYSDLDNIIAFVNSVTPLTGAEFCPVLENPDGSLSTGIEVSSSIPPLFGYQPFDSGGYKLYKGDNDPKSPLFQFNQVFPSSSFKDLLQGLCTASGSGSNQTGANYIQSLTTVDNTWFGVKGGRNINVLWVYLNMIESWKSELSQDVQKKVEDTENFPHYNTFTQLELSNSEVNLMVSLTSWNMVEGSKQDFLDMYK